MLRRVLLAASSPFDWAEWAACGLRQSSRLAEVFVQDSCLVDFFCSSVVLTYGCKPYGWRWNWNTKKSCPANYKRYCPYISPWSWQSLNYLDKPSDRISSTFKVTDGQFLVWTIKVGQFHVFNRYFVMIVVMPGFFSILDRWFWCEIF